MCVGQAALASRNSGGEVWIGQKVVQLLSSHKGEIYFTVLLDI